MESKLSIRKVSIAKDFSEYPAGRLEEDGPWNGEKFRNEHLLPAMMDEDTNRVEVDFDGLAGCGSSFLEEGFGGLIREEGFDKATIDRKLHLKTTEAELRHYVALARKYIEESAEEARQK